MSIGICLLVGSQWQEIDQIPSVIRGYGINGLESEDLDNVIGGYRELAGVGITSMYISILYIHYITHINTTLAFIHIYICSTSITIFFYPRLKIVDNNPHHVKIHITYETSPDGWAVWGVVMSTRWWLLVDHCVLRNWDRILVRAVKGLISRAGMVLICPLLW